MILDFAAANDPSLVEEGMRMASGYRSAVDYRSSLHPPTPAVVEPAAVRPAPPPAVEEITTRPEPALRPVPTPEPPRPPLEAIRTEAPARHVEPPRPAAEAPRAHTQVPTHAPPHEVRRTPTPVSPHYDAPAPTRGDTQVGPVPTYDYDDDAPTRVHDVESITAQASELPARGDKTVVAGSPTRTYGSEARRPAAQWTPPAAPVQEEARYAPPPEDVETRPEAELPVTPAPRRPMQAAVEAPRAAAAAESYADDLDSADLDDYPVRRGSAAGTIFVTILLLAALGLVGASIAIKQTPDPRPLLQDLIRQNM
jgi:hypothetical protein